VKLQFWRENLYPRNLWTIARGSTRVFSVVIVQLSDGDTTAFGEASPISRYYESVESVEAFLRKVDSRNLSFDDMPGSMKYLEDLAAGSHSAKCAVNIALLDGAAKRARKPLHEFLGLPFHENTHVTSFTIGISTPDEIRSKVLAAEQYPILKLKFGSSHDLENLAALREIAPAKQVRIDANEGWPNKEVALCSIEHLAEDPNIELIEQPLPASIVSEDFAWLKTRSPLPLFADESYHSAGDARQCAEMFHGVNIKLTKAGGITPALEALKAARSAGLQTMLGCMVETSVLISAAAHLAGLCDYLDLDGNLLISNDPFSGVAARGGCLSFASAAERFGIRVLPVK
jgi:L-alanine-DL-glutamate epimerase-like enolase superfamily enzyme